MPNSTSLPFVPVKGTQEEINSLTPKDGYLYFALDTKKIFYGQNHTLIPMGGTSSIHYGNQDDLDPIYAEATFYDPEDFNKTSNELEDLNVDDLILNSNGAFYRVITKTKHVNNTIEYYCTRLTVAGSGGGSGTNANVITSFKWDPNIVKSYTILGQSSLLINIDWQITTSQDDLLTDHDYEITFIQGNSINDTFSTVKRTPDNTLTFNLYENGSKTFDLSKFIPTNSRSDQTLPIFCYMNIDDGQKGYVTKEIIFSVTYAVVDCNWDYVTKELYNTKIAPITDGKWIFNYHFNDRASYNHYYQLFINGQLIKESDIIFPGMSSKENYSAEVDNLSSYINTINDVELKIYASFNSKEKREGYVLVSNNFIGKILLYSLEADFSVIGTSLTNFTYSQYELITIPIIIYNPNSSTGFSTVQMLNKDNEELAKIDVRNLVWENFYFNAINAGEAIKLKFNIPGQTSVEYFFNIQELNLGMWTAVENSDDTNYNQSLILNFNPKNFSGNEGLLGYCPENDKPIIFSENFDFNNGGYKTESTVINGIQTQYSFFRICAGDEIKIPTSIFTNNTGLCFKIIFRALNCEKFDAIWGRIKNSKNLAIDYLPLKAHSIDLSHISQRTFSKDIKYISDEIIEFEFDIAAGNKNIFGETTTNAQEIMSLTWLNGTPYSVIGALGNHPQLLGADMLILGSEDCDIDIFLIKGYNTYLPLKEHLQNYIADSLTAPQLAQRLQRNNILTDLSSNNIGRILDIDIEKLILNNKKCIVHEYIASSVPVKKLKYDDKSTRKLKSGCTKGCVYKQYRYGEKKVDDEIINFGYELSTPYLIHPDCDIGVQGTSSVNYVISAANLDTNFAYSSFADSKNELITTENPDYEFINEPECYVINRGKASPSNKSGPKLYNYYKMSSSSMGCNYMNTKVNVASAENANNSLLAQWYQKFNPYISPVRKMNIDDNKNQHRDTLEFTNGVLFFVDANKNKNSKDAQNKPTDNLNNVFQEYNSYMNIIQQEPNSTIENASNLFDLDSRAYPQFYGICNFGNSKKNTDIFHRADELCMEIKKQDAMFNNKLYTQFYNEIEDTIIKDRVSGWQHPDFIDNEFEFRFDKSMFIDPDDDEHYYKITELPSESLELLTNLDFNTNFNLNSKYGSSAYKNYALHQDIADINENYYELKEVFPHETYHWKIYDQFSYWARLVNWFAHNNPNACPSLDELNKLEEEQKNSYLLSSPETYLKSQSLLTKELNPWIVNTLGINTIFKNDEDSIQFDYDCKERRILKMFEECESFISLDSLVYHYLFIEKHSLVDNAAKNTFWSTSLDSGYLIWDICKDYDNDTASGNDNTGHLSNDFGHENSDVGSNKILNGNGAQSDNDEQSGMVNPWLNFISNLDMILAKGYRDRRYAEEQAAAEENKTYLDYVYDWQESIPEICWIADCYRKYLRPVFVYGDRPSAGDTQNAEFLDKLEGGKKTFQRKYFEKYQTAYLDSKYLYKALVTYDQSKDDLDKNLFRGALTQNDSGEYVVSLVPYHKGYLCISSSETASDGVQVKVDDINKEYFLKLPEDYSAAIDGYLSVFYPDNIRQLGSANNKDGLFGYFNPKAINFNVTSFPRLSSLYINSQDEPLIAGYINPSLSFSDNNVLLKKIIAKNMHKTIDQEGESNSINIEGLSSLTRLKELDLTGSDYKSIEIATGSMLENLKAESLEKLVLNSLTRYKFKQEDIKSFKYLNTLKVNNIDTNYQNSLPLLKQVLNDQNAQNGLVIFEYHNFNWILTDTDINSSTNRILILDKLIQLFDSNLSTNISGRITLPSTNNPQALYNYYIFSKSLYQIDFQFETNNLYNFSILDYENNPIWEKRFSAKKDIIDSNFYNEGIYSNKQGIKSWAEIKNNVLQRQADSKYTYELKALKIKIGNQSGVINDNNTIEELLNNTVNIYDLLNDYLNDNNISEISDNVEIIPEFKETLLYVKLIVYVSKEKNGEGLNPQIYDIQLESDLTKIIDTIKFIPYYTDQEPDNEMYLWTGLSLTPSGQPLPDDYKIENQTTLYALFTDEAKKVGELTWNHDLLKLYRQKNILNIHPSFNEGRRILTSLNTDYLYKGKVVLCPNSDIQFSFITESGPNNILGKDCSNTNEIEKAENDQGITHILFIKNFSVYDSTQISNKSYHIFTINSQAFMNLTELQYINLDNLNIDFRKNEITRRIVISSNAFSNCNLSFNTFDGYDCITFSGDYTFKNAFNSAIDSLILKNILSFGNSGNHFVYSNNELKEVELNLTTLLKGLNAKEVGAYQDLSTLFSNNGNTNQYKILNKITLIIDKNSVELNELSTVKSHLLLTTFGLDEPTIDNIQTEEDLYRTLIIQLANTYLKNTSYGSPVESHTDTTYRYTATLIE